MNDDDIVAAVHRNELADLATRTVAAEHPGTPAHELAVKILATCESIGRTVATERDRLTGLLGAAGVAVAQTGPMEPAQRHVITVDLAEGDVDRAVDVLERDGYARHHTWARGAARSFRRVSSEVSLASAGDVTTLVHLRWRSPRRRGPADRLLRPTPADWAAIELPASLWWAYPLVRLGRLTLERGGLRSRDHAALEPFLVTPRSLIDPVLEVAATGPNDVVLDFGCGDGRLLIEAVTRRGCRAIGVEQSAALAAVATEAVEAQGLSDRVRISHGDALAADLREVTVVVLFLPLVVGRRVIPVLLDRLSPGTRIVLHEQSALPSDLPTPQMSMPIITADAVTVAHRWDITGRE